MVRRLPWAALAALTVGCGQLLGLDDPVDARPDAGLGSDGAAADSTADVAVDADARETDAVATPEAETGPSRACDPTRPFGAPTPLPGVDLNAPSDEGSPRLSPDERTLYFWSDRALPSVASGTHLFSATRATSDAAFGASALLIPPVTGRWDASPTVSANGLELVFQASPADGASGDLYLATRALATAPFEAPILLTSASTSAPEASPFLRPDGGALYFSSGRPSSAGGQDLYRAPGTGAGSFGPPSAIAELNTRSDEYSPTLSSDELTIFWASDRADLGAHGSFDIYVAHRANPSDGFGAPANAGDTLNSSGSDLPGWLSPDGCALYLESGRAGSRGGTDLFVARRPR